MIGGVQRAHNLPRRPRLLGRDLLADSVVRMLGESHTAGVLIHGPPGVGKSAVALEIGHRMLTARPRRGHDVIWMTAQPAQLTRDGLLEAATVTGTVGDIVTCMCATLDRSDILRALPDEQIRLLHAELARRRVLVVIDSLDEVSDPRVPSLLLNLPAPTAVLATSRDELAFGTSVAVGPLPEAMASDLANYVDRKTFKGLAHEHRQLLLDITGGVPLALIWGLALLATGRPPTDVLAELAASDNDLLRFCFDGLWASLSDDGKTVASAIAMFPHGAADDSVALVGGLDDEQLKAGLAELQKHALVELPDDRRRLLPTTRSYVLGRVSARADDLLRMRWAEEICVSAATASQRGSYAEVFTGLEHRRADMEDLLEWSAKNETSSVADRGSVLWMDLAYFLFSAGYWDLLLRHRAWATRKLLDQGLIEEYLAALLNWVAHVCMLRDDLEGRDACFAEAASVIALVEGPADLYRAIFDFNVANTRTGDPTPASRIELLEHAAATFAELGEDRWEAMARNRLGNVIAGRDLADRQADVAYERCVEIASRNNGKAWARELAALGHGNPGILANRRGEHALALTLLYEARPDITQRFDAATLMMELAIAHYKTGNRRTARRLGSQAQRRAEQLGIGVAIAESDVSFEADILPTLGGPLARSSWLRARSGGSSP
jgi:hypothetical protein